MRPEIEKAVTMLQSGRPEALDQALALLQNTVFSFSMKVCGHREDAEDTMQDVLLKAVPYLPKFDSPKALVVWLYTVAKNRCLMSRRRSKFAPKEELSLEELMPDPAELDHSAAMAANGQTPEAAVLESELAEQLRQAVLKLPPPYRLVLVLHDMEELSTEEVARIIGLKEGNVRVRLHRARLFVRNEVAKARSARLSPHRMRLSLHGAKPARPGDGRAGSKSARRGKTGLSTGGAMAAAGTATTPPPGACKQMFAQLSDYLDGALDQSLCDELERHMSGCKPCHAFLATLRNTIEQVRSVNGGRPDERTAAELRHKILTAFQKTSTTVQ